MLSFIRNLMFVPLAAAAYAAPAHADGPLDAYLPKSGVISGHTISFAISPEDQEISQRFREAVQRNMAWFARAVQSSKAGQPLPYDDKMGITEAQYQQLIHMKPSVHEGATVSVQVDRAADGTVHFKPQGEGGASLAKVAFPPGEKTADTPYGKLSIFNEIHQKDPNAPIGVWNGAEWAQVEPPGASQPSAKIAFGKRADGEGMMYYQVAASPGGAGQSLVVYYKLD